MRGALLVVALAVASGCTSMLYPSGEQLRQEVADSTPSCKVGAQCKEAWETARDELQLLCGSILEESDTLIKADEGPLRNGPTQCRARKVKQDDEHYRIVVETDCPDDYECRNKAHFIGMHFNNLVAFAVNQVAPGGYWYDPNKP